MSLTCVLRLIHVSLVAGLWTILQVYLSSLAGETEKRAYLSWKLELHDLKKIEHALVLSAHENGRAY